MLSEKVEITSSLLEYPLAEFLASRFEASIGMPRA
jgi:hypothetical protein